MDPLFYLKAAWRLQFLSSYLTKDLLVGAYRSAFRGSGIEFEEVRPFEPGDEIRALDWSATAKMQVPYVKTFKEERERPLFLLIDQSASCLFGGKKETKREMMIHIAASLGFSAFKNQDKVGLVLFSDGIDRYIPPKKGLKHLLRILFEILVHKGKGAKTDLKGALQFFGKLAFKESICFVLSDFLSSSCSSEVHVLAKKHDLIAIAVQDPYEINFPSLGVVRLKDLETKEECWIDTNDTEVKKIFKEKSLSKKEEMKKMFLQSGAGWIEVFCGETYLDKIRKFFKLRQSRRR